MHGDSTSTVTEPLPAFPDPLKTLIYIPELQGHFQPLPIHYHRPQAHPPCQQPSTCCCISPLLHLLPSHGKRRVEPLLEGAAALEDGWEQEVEESPELRELVLERGSSEEQPPRGHVVRVEHLRQFAVVVLHPVPLVHDHVLPADLREREGRGWWELGQWMCPERPATAP